MALWYLLSASLSCKMFITLSSVQISQPVVSYGFQQSWGFHFLEAESSPHRASPSKMGTGLSCFANFPVLLGYEASTTYLITVTQCPLVYSLEIDVEGA